jgi:hypothetical protein
MALLPCPECGRQVSNMAVACPQCGHPLNIGEVEQQTSTGGTRTRSARGWDPRELQQIVSTSLLPGKKPWFLSTVNGTGVKMFGFLPVLTHDSRLLGLALAAMCILFVPVIPIGMYLVERPDYQLYRFLGRVPFAACWRGLGPMGSLRILRAIITEMLLYQAVFIGVVIIITTVIYAIRR